MTLHTRLAKAATAVRRLAAADCPGVGTVTALVEAGQSSAPDPPPCRVCGGWHVRVIEEVIVESAEPDPGGRTNPVNRPDG